MRVAIYTLGCKVNQYETQALETELERRGHTLVPFTGEADAYIINTCTVTAVSDQKSRQTIRQARKRAPRAVVAVCGCYAQTAPEAVRALEVDLVMGTGERMAFLDALEDLARARQAQPLVRVDDALRAAAGRLDGWSTGPCREAAARARVRGYRDIAKLYRQLQEVEQAAAHLCLDLAEGARPSGLLSSCPACGLIVTGRRPAFCTVCTKPGFEFEDVEAPAAPGDASAALKPEGAA